jgi:hypothetical protein
MTIAEAIYLLCAATSLVAAWLLFRHYVAKRTRLLLWSCVAFAGLAVNNVLVYVDMGLLPQLDLALPRTLAGALGMAALAYALATERAE